VDIWLLLAYFLPICFLAVFIGHTGKKFVLYLLWGFIASIPVVLLYPVIVERFPEIVSPALTISPVIEEFFKALPIVIPVILGHRNNNRDILVCALASGIGFSIMENWLLFGTENLGVFAVIVRSFSTSLMHGCTCGIIGYGMVLIRDSHKKALPALLLGFYMVAVLIHAFYNLNALYLGLAGTVADLFLPVVLFMLLLLCYHVDIPTLFLPDTELQDYDPPA
jgi:RsiW-degrading membrane proteinase PrsW (M82 family)